MHNRQLYKNILKFDILPTKTEDHQLTKNGPSEWCFKWFQFTSQDGCAGNIHVIYRKVYP